MKINFIIFTLFLATPLHCLADWELMQKSSSSETYIDPNRIQILGNSTVAALFMENITNRQLEAEKSKHYWESAGIPKREIEKSYQEDLKLGSTVSIMKINCSTLWSSIPVSTGFTDQKATGNILWKRTDNRSDYMNMIPRPKLKNTMKKACNLAGIF